MTTIIELEALMISLAKDFQAGTLDLDTFIAKQAALSEEIANVKVDTTKAAAKAQRVAREAEAEARQLIATQVSEALEGFDLFETATAVVTITPGDTGPLFGCKVTLHKGVLGHLATIIRAAGYDDLAFAPVAEFTFNSDGIVDVELKVKAGSTPTSTSGCKAGTWYRGDVGPVSLAKAYESAMDDKAKEEELELDRRIRTKELAKGSYGNESWRIKVAAVHRHGWEKQK